MMLKMNNNSINNLYSETLLIELNREELVRSSGLIVFLILIAMTGIPGNILVCVVYRNSYRTSMSRYFIFWLAVNDTINSCVTVLELISVSYPYTYPSEWLCKFTIFLEMCPTLTSGMLLAVISVDRYNKVCRPFRGQIRKKHAWIICVVITSFALLFSWPTFIFFGLREVDLGPHNVTGYACLFRKEHDGTIQKTIYGGLLWLIFMSVLVILIVLYSLIGRTIVQQIKKNENLTKKYSYNFPTQQKEESMSVEMDQSPSTSSTRNEITINSCKVITNQSNTSSASNRKSARIVRAKRSAFVMFLISLVFVVSFVPYLTLRLKEALNKDFVPSLNDNERAVYNFFLRLYFLNCAVNPFIYGACNSQFRKGVKDLIRRRY